MGKWIDREKLFAYFFLANGKYIGTLLVDLKGYPNVLTDPFPISVPGCVRESVRV